MEHCQHTVICYISTLFLGQHFTYDAASVHLVSPPMRRTFQIIRLTVIEILAIINWYSKITVSNIVYLLTSILLTLTLTLMHFSIYQNSSVLDCENVWTLTVDILNTICNRDCFADCSLDLTPIVSFWKIALLVCRWKQIIISRSSN